MKHLFSILTLIAALIIAAPAQSLFEKSEGVKIAEQIDASQTELIRHMESQLVSMYAKVNTPGKQAEILQGLGTKAVEAFTRYAKARALLIELDPTAAQRIPAPDQTVFIPNADGTMTYKAPPAPVVPTAPTP